MSVCPCCGPAVANCGPCNIWPHDSSYDPDLVTQPCGATRTNIRPASSLPEPCRWYGDSYDESNPCQCFQYYALLCQDAAPDRPDLRGCSCAQVFSYCATRTELPCIVNNDYDGVLQQDCYMQRNEYVAYLVAIYYFDKSQCAWKKVSEQLYPADGNNCLPITPYDGITCGCPQDAYCQPPVCGDIVASPDCCLNEFP